MQCMQGDTLFYGSNLGKVNLLAGTHPLFLAGHEFPPVAEKKSETSHTLHPLPSSFDVLSSLQRLLPRCRLHS